MDLPGGQIHGEVGDRKWFRVNALPLHSSARGHVQKKLYERVTPVRVESVLRV
jgi:hypothetical protein